MFESILSCRLATFTVNVAANSVPISPGVLNDPESIFINTLGYAYFKAKDCILIKSVSFVLPYCFSLADQRANARFFYEKISTGATSSLAEIGSYGTVWFMSENLEHEFNTFWQWKTNIATETAVRFRAYSLQGEGNAGIPPTTYPAISMLNVPAALDTLVMPVFAFMKVIHTLPLQAAP